LDPQFTGVCHLLIKINTENNHICIRGFDNDPYKILKDAAPDFHDLGNLGDPDKDDAFSCSLRFVARLYDQKKSFASSHHNINKLRVKLVTGRDASLVRLPPSEAALRQHILRASFQTKFGILPVWQNHICLHQWNTDGELSLVIKPLKLIQA
jgi:hypothetical protein